MAFIAAAVLLAAFVGNVVIGATTNAAPLGNVSEMLLLLASSIFFVVAILKKESDAKAEAGVDKVQGGH